MWPPMLPLFPGMSRAALQYRTERLAAAEAMLTQLQGGLSAIASWLDDWNVYLRRSKHYHAYGVPPADIPETFPAVARVPITARVWPPLLGNAIIDASVALHDVGERRDVVLGRLGAGEAIPERVVARFEGLRVTDPELKPPHLAPQRPVR